MFHNYFQTKVTEKRLFIVNPTSNSILMSNSAKKASIDLTNTDDEEEFSSRKKTPRTKTNQTINQISKFIFILDDLIFTLFSFLCLFYFLG